MVSTRYDFQLVIAGGLALYLGKRSGKGIFSLFKAKNWGVQALRSAVLFGQTVSFYAQSFFIPISISNSLTLAHRTLFVILLARVFKEEIHKKWWVAGSTLLTFIGVGLMYLATNYGVDLSFATHTKQFHFVLAAAPANESGANNLLYGWLAVVANTLCTATGLHCNRAAATSGESKWTTLFLSGVVGFVVSVPFWFISLPHVPAITMPDFSGESGQRIAMWFGVMIGFSILVQLLQQISAGKLPTTILALIAPMQVPFGMFLDYVLFGKIPSIAVLIAMVLLIAGSFTGIPSMKEAERVRKQAKRQRILRKAFYCSSKGWLDFRPKNRKLRLKLLLA